VAPKSSSAPKSLPANARLSESTFFFRLGKRVFLKRLVAHLTADDLARDKTLLHELQGSDRTTIVLDVRRVVDLPVGSGDYWISPEGASRNVATAMVAQLNSTSLLGNVLSFCAWTATYPLRVFTDPERATQWLGQYDGEKTGLTEYLRAAREALGPEADDFGRPADLIEQSLGSEVIETQLAVLGRFIRSLIGRDFSKKLDVDDLNGDTFRLLGAALNVLEDEFKLLIRSQKRIEEELRRKIETAARLSALGEMAGCIVYEINNPIAVIQGKSRQIQRALQADDLDREVIEKHSKTIETTSERIVQIMQGIRAFSRDGSQDGMRKERLEAIVRESLSMVAARYHSHGIEIRCAQVPDDIELFCSPVQIGQVFLNLLNNAFDAVCELTERWVELTFLDGGDTVEIWFTDSGSGIPKELVGRIFQTFFTTKPAGKGTGLGLGIAAAIIERHHGKVSVDRDCPHTRFVIDLPKVATRAAKDSA